MASVLAFTVPAAAKHHSESKATTNKKSSSSSSSHKSSSTAHRSSTSKKSTSHSAKKSSSKAHVQTVACKKGRKCKATVKKVRGQQGIESDRAREIQSALIREHYMDGEPSGVFDDRTKQALMKYQQDNGWQNKVVPDSRALIKLGLGPSKDGLLNPESAALASPQELGTEREIPGGATPSRK